MGAILADFSGFLRSRIAGGRVDAPTRFPKGPVQLAFPGILTQRTGPLRINPRRLEKKERGFWRESSAEKAVADRN